MISLLFSVHSDCIDFEIYVRLFCVGRLTLTNFRLWHFSLQIVIHLRPKIMSVNLEQKLSEIILHTVPCLALLIKNSDISAQFLTHRPFSESLNDLQNDCNPSYSFRSKNSVKIEIMRQPFELA